MRLVRFNDWRTGVMVSDDTFVDIAESIDGLRTHDQPAAEILSPLFTGENKRDWTALIEQWDAARGPLSTLVSLAGAADGVVTRAFADVDLLPPLPSPRPRVFAIGANFADHGSRSKTKLLGRTVTEEEILAERAAGLPPWGFIAVPGTITGSGGTVYAPRGVTMLDYEAEVAVVLRRGGRELSAGELEIWGYTGWNDMSIRDHFFGRGTAIDRGILIWTLAKNFEGSNPCGTWLCVDEPHDVGNLRMQSRVNGETRQDSTTAKMIWSFGDTAAHISDYIPLLPGDMIVSGTPAGPMIEQGEDGIYLQAGDEVEIEIEGAGILRTTVGKPAGWPTKSESA